MLEAETEIVNLLQPRCNVIKDHKEVDELLAEDTKLCLKKQLVKFDTSSYRRQQYFAYNNDNHEPKFLVNLEETSLKYKKLFTNNL